MAPDKYVIAGTGYTGARVLAGIDAGSALALSRNQRSGSFELMPDLDSGDLSVAPPVGAYSIVYTIPPSREGSADARLERFLQWLDEPPLRIVYISTSGVYGHTGGAMVDENTKPAPQNTRSQRRLAAEQALLDFTQDNDIRSVILRSPAIYGPGRLGLERIRNASPVIREDQCNPGNRIHVDDLAACCIAALDDGVEPGIYNVVDGDFRSATWFTQTVAAMAGLPRVPEISRDEAESQFSAERLSFTRESRRLDNSKMLRDLRGELTYANPEDGIRASLESDRSDIDQG